MDLLYMDIYIYMWEYCILKNSLRVLKYHSKSIQRVGKAYSKEYSKRVLNDNSKDSQQTFKMYLKEYSQRAGPRNRHKKPSP